MSNDYVTLAHHCNIHIDIQLSPEYNIKFLLRNIKTFLHTDHQMISHNQVKITDSFHEGPHENPNLPVSKSLSVTPFVASHPD